MKTRATRVGPFSERPYYTQSDIDQTCIDELNKAGLLPSEPGPVRIDRFIEKRFGRPHSYASLPPGILGLTRFGASGVQEIVLAEQLENDLSRPNERRIRTTLAHEAGHGLLHAHLFVLGRGTQPLLGDWSDKAAPKVLCRGDVERPDYKGEWWEYQANMVIGSLLLPRPLVNAVIQPYLSARGLLGLSNLSPEVRQRAFRELAEVFDVNPVVVRIRLAEMFPEPNAGQLTL